MTRTNDAPVTVEDANAMAWAIVEKIATAPVLDGPLGRVTKAREAVAARHRLAALDSAPAGDGVAGKRQAIEACACIADRIRDEFAAQATDTGGVFDENDYAAVAVAKVATSIRALSADEMEAHPLGAPWHARQPIEDMAKTWRGNAD